MINAIPPIQLAKSNTDGIQRDLAFTNLWTHRGKWIVNAILAFVGLSAAPSFAQSSLVFANPVVFPGLRQQGFVITTAVSQTATTSNITYSITPPANYVHSGDTMIGQLNIQALLPAGSQMSVKFTIAYTGWANVLGLLGGGILAGGFNIGASPQTATIDAKAGAGMLSFFLSGSSISNPQPAPASSISVSANLGNPEGGRKAYLNDYTGLGKSNYAIWRPTEGNWYVFPVTAPPVIMPWGLPGDVPVPGDYDADGITDFAVWRPSEGNWYVILSSTGQQIVTQWGLPGDVPILAGDYDGDGRTDFAVWRPSEGNWYVQLSSTGAEVVMQWGVSGDIPVSGDFDGDGKADFAVWRPSEGNWYIVYSGTGTQVVQQWGLTGDLPDGRTLTSIPIH